MKAGWLLPVSLVAALVLLPTLILRPERTDLHILVQATQRLLNHEAVYRLEDPNEHTKPPLATLAFAPIAQIPPFALARLWDLLNLVALPVLLLLLSPPHRGWAALALLIVLGPWNAELRIGQYNVVLLLWIVFAAKYQRVLSLGVGLALAVLFKPTFVFVAPWALLQSRHPFRTAAAALVTVLTLAGMYVELFGWNVLVSDVSGWMAFLPLSSQKHLLRFDNYGLPSAFAAAGWNLSEGAFLGVGLVVGTLAALVPGSLAGLALACLCTILFSPMAWFQNYALTLPFIVWLSKLLHAERSGTVRVLYAGAFVSLAVGLVLINPTTCAWMQCGSWGWPRPPLWMLLIALFLVGAGRVSRVIEKGKRAVAGAAEN